MIFFIDRILSSDKNKISKFIDRSAFVFFFTLLLSIPISNAGVELSFGFILLCLILKGILQRPSIESIKGFFSYKVNRALLIFYIAIGLSLFVSGPLFMKSLAAWIFKWGEGVILFYAARIFLKKKDIKILLFVCVLSGLVISIDGLYQKIIGVDFIRGYSLLKLDAFDFFAITASFKHYNNLSGFLVVVFFIGWGFLVYSKNTLRRIFIYICLLFIFTAILLTYSRGGWVSLLSVALFIGILCDNKKIKTYSLVVLAFFLLGIAYFPSFRERFLFIFKEGGDADRFNVWLSAVEMIKDSPFLGKGLGLFMDHFREYSTLNIQYAHNCYLQILAETGLFGFLTFLWFLRELLLVAWRSFVRKNNFLLLGLFSSTLAFLVHAFFDTHLFSLKLSVLFWVMTSFIVVYANDNLSSNNNIK